MTREEGVVREEGVARAEGVNSVSKGRGCVQERGRVLTGVARAEGVSKAVSPDSTHPHVGVLMKH